MTLIPTESRWIDRSWAIALTSYLAVLILIAISAYQGKLPDWLDRIPCYDLIGHFFLMGCAAYFTHRTLYRRHALFSGMALPLGPTVIAFTTLLDEAMQSFSPYRTVSLLDLSANCLGIIVFCAVDSWWLHRQTHRISR